MKTVDQHEDVYWCCGRYHSQSTILLRRKAKHNGNKDLSELKNRAELHHFSLEMTK